MYETRISSPAEILRSARTCKNIIGRSWTPIKIKSKSHNMAITSSSSKLRDLYEPGGAGRNLETLLLHWASNCDCSRMQHGTIPTPKKELEHRSMLQGSNNLPAEGCHDVPSKPWKAAEKQAMPVTSLVRGIAHVLAVNFGNSRFERDSKSKYAYLFKQQLFRSSYISQLLN